jgi:GAF domain-containing protein
MRGVDTADLLAQAAVEINAPDDLDATLDSITAAARRLLTGIDHASISVALRNGEVETQAATDDLVRELDALQYACGEGPCLDAIRVATLVRLEDAAHDPRWPSYTPGAVTRGVRSQVGLRLRRDGRTMGSLNLYSTSVDRLDDRVVHTADLFAVHAALAMGSARTVDQLGVALSTRSMIGQATGLLMERYSIDHDAAFAVLARISSVDNVKLRDVAAQVVAEADERFHRSR